MSPRVVAALLMVVFGGVVFAGCAGDDLGGESIRGSGAAASETREVDSFTAVDLEGFGDVTITIGPEQAVTVETDDNLLEHVTTRVSGETLEIQTEGRLDTDLGVKVAIVIPTLQAVTVSGAGNFVIDGLSAGTLDIRVNGSGDITAQGTTERLNVQVNGSGNVQLSDLVAAEVEIAINGAGNAHVHATDSLSASIKGAGNITYAGDPETVETSTEGVGAISKQ